MPEKATPPPTTSLAGAILASVLLLAASWLAALYREAVLLRPWKAYQERYFEQRRARLEAEIVAARAALASPPTADRQRAALAALAAAQERLASPPLRQEVDRLEGQLAVAGASLKRAQKGSQLLRGRQQELEYRLAGDGGAQVERELELLRLRTGAAEAAVERGTAVYEELSGQLAGLLREREQARAALAAITTPLEALEAARRALANERIEVRQILVQETGRADRCVSCHLAADGSRPPGEGQPFTAHPSAEVYLGSHPPDRFGCTLCHQGHGLALSSVRKAHGETPFWAEPLLRGEWAQASCQRCHEEAGGLRGARRLSRGIELLERYGCFGCHKIAGAENRARIGPPLSRVASKVSYAWLLAWLSDPRRTQEGSRMPNFGFRPEETRAVADFLFSLASEARTDEPVPAPRWDQVERGQALYGEARCSLCHAVNGRGGAFAGAFAPDLSRAGSKLRRAWILTWLEDPRAYHPLSRMPRFRLTAAEREGLAEFLISEGTDAELEAEKRTVPEPFPPQSVERGRKLVEEFGCSGCHEIEGLEKAEKIGPYLKVSAPQDMVAAELSTIGSKPLELLDFGRTAIPRTRKDYLLTKLATPRIFRDGLRMPDFALSTAEREALATLLLGFSSREIPRGLRVPAPLVGVAPGGAAGTLIRDLQCLTCHRIQGRGGSYAPDLSFEGSRVRREWLVGFLRAPNPIRPLLQQMPKFNLAPEEAATLAEYIGVSLRDPRLEESPGETGGEPGEGSRIWRERGCALCHQLGPQGGTVGPDLTGLRQRMEPAFVRHHLLDPRISNSAGPEPRYLWTDEELGHVAAYLFAAQPLEP